MISLFNLPGYRMRSRYFPDGRDLNRESPGSSKGNTTSRVAKRIFENIIKGSDYVIDAHTAARGRTNLPQIQQTLALEVLSQTVIKALLLSLMAMDTFQFICI